MAENPNKPLPIKSKLAGNPDKAPGYGVTAKLSSGQELSLADPKATRALVSLMDMQAVLGGAASHFGGPSAFAELMSAVHGFVFNEAQQKGSQWFDEFHLVNDAGHCENGLYALKANYGFADLSLASLKGFRSIQSQLTGHGEAHLFPEGVYLSNGPLGSSLPQAQGLCFADKMAGHSRVTITAISDGACMEGEAKEALAAIPGLAQKSKMAPFVLIISDNNTKLSGRIDEDSFSMNPSFASLKDLGWHVIEQEDGHDIQKCLSNVEEAVNLVRKNPNQPVVIHAKTIKGYGVEKTEKSSSGGHGFPLKDPNDLTAFLQEIYKGEEVPAEFTQWCEDLISEFNAKKSSSSSGGAPTEKVQVGVSAALIEKHQAGLPVVSISSDLPGSTGTAAFQKQFPNSSIDVGVAESNMVSMGAGLSKQGFIPVVDTFSQFGATKGALPLIMSALSQAPVIAIFSHAGFQDAADGASHQALSYFAMTSSIPHTNVYSLSCSGEAKALVGQAVEEFAKKRTAGETPSSSIFFLGRENFPQNYVSDESAYKLGQAQVVFDNTNEKPGKLTIAACGPLLHQALAAAMKLEEAGHGCIVVNPSTISHPDVETFRSCLRNTEQRLVTVEDHQTVGGMGANLIHHLAQAGVDFKSKSLGVDGEFGQSSYTAIELYAKHGLDAAGIEKASKTFLSQ